MSLYVRNIGTNMLCYGCQFFIPNRGIPLEAKIFIRFYRKGLRRKPIRVSSRENQDESPVAGSVNATSSLFLPPKQRKNINNGINVNLKNNVDRSGFNYSRNILSEEMNSKRHVKKAELADVPQYEKLQNNDPRFTTVMTLLKSRKKREKKERILLEGRRLISDAISADIHPESIFFSQEQNLREIPLNEVVNVQLFKVSYKQLSLWSDLTTSPGVMGCVDLWEPKVLRSACGAHFRVPILNNIYWEVLQNYFSEDAIIYLADNCNEHKIIPQAEKNKPQELENENIEKFVVVNDEGKQLKVDPSYKCQEVLEAYRNVSLPIQSYSDTLFSNCETVLIIGGETEGLSLKAFKLACERGGRKLVIPIENGVDSLNSSVAAAILLFEIKRQLALDQTREKQSI
ncbi:rRNA methyltransferase 3, mitochondrial-like isoform X2 [Limulus polyphemus]|uniref:rRNA methyltransferase 3, mitochondrial-like isoform X2 n=1 Tax=Limulus polyphemus TaxID=6850 RepID=A0ABM1SSX3_LIMPO|nr:rRNA methyltransferase 3, mitochondrial-like isoform X2 [Limulus polyphemus]